jgi:type II secretory pathway pseudopilin PulG
MPGLDQGGSDNASGAEVRVMWSRYTDKMRKAFSIAELVIVAAIIGILAALLVPSMHSHAVGAKEAAAREDLQLLRGAIELYAARHGGTPPGYEGTNQSSEPTAELFESQMTVQDRCLLQIPENPFNNLSRVRIIANEGTFPAVATGHDGWIYQPATKNIRVDWPGTDSRGIRCLDY